MLNSSTSADTAGGPTWGPDWDNYYTEELGIRITDQILGWVFILGTIVGLLGNGSAVCYFWPKRNQSVHNMLYLAIITVDFLTVASSFPVIASLLNDRYPMIFNKDVFCSAWTLVSSFTAKMSIFLAAMICVTRTIAMRCPYLTLKRTSVISAIAGYAILLIALDLTYISFKWEHGQYVNSTCLCSAKFYETAPIVVKYIATVSLILQLTLPSFITFFCFVASTWFLMTRATLLNVDERKFRRVSVTITIFTVIFLICNIPCFVYQMFSFLSWDFPELLNVFDHRYFNYYGPLLLQFFPIFLNSAINPSVYLLRMRGYQNWIKRCFRMCFSAKVAVDG